MLFHAANIVRFFGARFVLVRMTTIQAQTVVGLGVNLVSLQLDAPPRLLKVLSKIGRFDGLLSGITA
jgi:hypothetical protein